MKKFVLKEYDNGKIIYYKTFEEENELLKFINHIKKSNPKIQGPVEKDGKIVYWIDDKLTFNI